MKRVCSRGDELTRLNGSYKGAADAPQEAVGVTMWGRS
jgi:hypothetical protein